MSGELLEYLLRHRGQVVSRESLTRDVWNENRRSGALDNIIDVHIARLRRKLGLDATGDGDLFIHTVRGVGFMIERPPDEDVPQ